MKLLNKIMAIIAVAGLAMANTACIDDGLKSVNGSLSDGSNGSSGGITNPGPVDDGEVDMSKLNAELDAVEAEMDKVSAQLAAYSVIGNANSGAQTGLDKTFRTIFEKLLGGVAKAKEKVNELKAKVQDRINRLDPTNPLHLIAIQKLQEAMVYLDGIGGQLDDQILRLVQVMDEGVAKIDQKIAQIDNIAAQIAAMFLWEPIKLVIFEYRDKLLDAAGA